MKNRYRIIARQKREAERRLQRPRLGEDGFAATEAEPVEMVSEFIDLVTGGLADPRPLKRARRK